MSLADEIRGYYGCAADQDQLMHYGIKRRSGRYPWGSGDNPYQRSSDWISRVDELKKSGEEHYSATTAECNAVISRLDDEFSKNRERWTDEIYKSIVSVN